MAGSQAVPRDSWLLSALRAALLVFFSLHTNQMRQLEPAATQQERDELMPGSSLLNKRAVSVLRDMRVRSDTHQHVETLSLQHH